MFFGLIVWAVLTYLANRTYSTFGKSSIKDSTCKLGKQTYTWKDGYCTITNDDGIHYFGTKTFNVKDNVWTEIK